MQLPPPEPLPNRTVNCPYVIIADDAFALKTYLMKPYPQQNLDNAKRVCNYWFSSARRVVENVFSILANRWRVFRTPIALMSDKVEIVVMAAVTMHNWLLKSANEKESYITPAVVNPQILQLVSLLLVHGGTMQKLPTFCLSERILALNPHKVQKGLFLCRRSCQLAVGKMCPEIA